MITNTEYVKINGVGNKVAEGATQEPSCVRHRDLIQRLNAQLAIVSTAKAAYGQASDAALPKAAN